MFVDQWKCLSDDQRQMFIDASIRDKERFNRQMQEFEKTGKFTAEEIKWVGCLPEFTADIIKSKLIIQQPGEAIP